MLIKNKNLVKHKKDIIFYFSVFLVMLLLNRAKIIEIKMPFAQAFAFSLVYLKRNVIIIALSYFLSAIIYDFSIQSLIISANVFSVLILIYFIKKLFNRNLNFICLTLTFIFGQVGYLYFNFINPMQILISIVSVIVSIMFLYISSQVLGAIINRGIQSRLTFDENICLFMFLIVVFSGVADIYIYKIDLTSIIVVFLILFMSRVLNKTKTMFLSQIMGIGVSVYLSSITNIAIYSSYAIFCIGLRDKPKILSVLAVVLTDMVFGYFFNVYLDYSFINILCVLFGGFLFMILPINKINFLKNYSYDYEGRLADEFIVSGQRIILKNKILRISELFSQIHNTYKQIGLKELDKENAVKILTDDVIEKHCKNCSNYNMCLEKEGIKQAINQLFEFGIEKNKVTVIDANNFLTKECFRLNGLINEINNNLDNYKVYQNSISSDESNKVVVSKQFEGTGLILKELSKMVVCGEKINYKTSKLLLDELTLNNIIASEVVVLENEHGVERIVLVVGTKDALNEKIGLCLNSIYKISFLRDVCKMARFAGWSILSFVPAPKYEISVGFSSKNKKDENVSGDNYSFLRLSNNRVLFAISDGMGHGEDANKISTTALNLIENFYESGFSSEVTLSSVNNIMLPCGENNFTTLDACVFNKNDGSVDFIKVGATCSVIKSETTSKLITQDSLPLGVLDNLKVSAKKCILKEKDMVILASDGVVDSFSSLEEYLNFVNNERVVNPQLMASIILDEAESRDVESRDDKTVIVFKVGYKV